MFKRRRIPFDFQRTSLAGLVLESATSSGLGRAPRTAMQDPIQAPPGTTRQAGLYTSSQDMLVRLSRAPVLSGGLRRKTQLFSCTLYMAASSKTPPH
ncbi:hypothetical protein TNCV_2621231 [Trichonephila clavipes]|uniref:Uncharacterized protein n=1 Tax=Trichonephila clavipes TaxID=2585209 RepID=A0A8X6WD15_TRICX|nr:hypothetical protein TNCV_2621231 [Trichonephila clavipes]